MADNYEEWMKSQAGRFSVSFYVIHNHYNDPNYPYTASAALIAASSSNPPVVMLQKPTGFPFLYPTLTNAQPSTPV